VLLALIYLFARRNGADDNSLPAQDTRYEPSLSAEENFDDVQYADTDEAIDDDAVISATTASRFDANDEPRRTGSNFTTATPAPGAVDGDESSSQYPSDSEPETDASASEHQSVADSGPPLDSASTPLVPEKVIALHLMPKAGNIFEGIEFIGAIQAEGLKFGRFDIFHRFANAETAGDAPPSQFSLANMIKPGTFNLHDLETQEFKGASMFLVLPGPEDAVAAFADMVATGRRLAATLDGQLLDAQGTALSRQSASHLREDIINYQHGLSAAPAE